MRRGSKKCANSEITEANDQEVTLKMHQITGEKLLDSLLDGVYFVDNSRCITFWNRAAERITGYSKSEAVGTYCSNNLLRHIDCDGRQLCLEGCPLAATIRDGKTREASVYLHHALGHRVPVSGVVDPSSSISCNSEQTRYYNE